MPPRFPGRLFCFVLLLTSLHNARSKKTRFHSGHLVREIHLRIVRKYIRLHCRPSGKIQRRFNDKFFSGIASAPENQRSTVHVRIGNIHRRLHQRWEIRAEKNALARVEIATAGTRFEFHRANQIGERAAAFDGVGEIRLRHDSGRQPVKWTFRPQRTIDVISLQRGVGRRRPIQRDAAVVNERR